MEKADAAALHTFFLELTPEAGDVGEPGVEALQLALGHSQLGFTFCVGGIPLVGLTIFELNYDATAVAVRVDTLDLRIHLDVDQVPQPSDLRIVPVFKVVWPRAVLYERNRSCHPDAKSCQLAATWIRINPERRLGSIAIRPHSDAPNLLRLQLNLRQ